MHSVGHCIVAELGNSTNISWIKAYLVYIFGQILKVENNSYSCLSLLIWSVCIQRLSLSIALSVSKICDIGTWLTGRACVFWTHKAILLISQILASPLFKPYGCIGFLLTLQSTHPSIPSTFPPLSARILGEQLQFHQGFTLCQPFLGFFLTWVRSQRSL